MERMNSNIDQVVITTGYECNNDCVMCSVGSKLNKENNSTTEEIFKILSEGRKNNAKDVDFTGGEPTVRKDLVRLISYAKKLGYKTIGISTNGMLLSDNSYCEKLVKAGLNSILFSLHAPNKEINSAINNTPNSFDRTIAGIKNAIKYKNVAVNVATAVQKINLAHLVEIGNLVNSLGVNIWTLCDLVPEGMAKDKYAALSVKRIDIYNILKIIIPLFNNSQLLLCNFTQCTIPRGLLERNIITISSKWNENRYINYDKNETSFTEKNIKEYATGLLNKISICNKCIYSEKCVGYWSDYFSLYGEEDITKLATENGCINRQLLK